MTTVYIREYLTDNKPATAVVYRDSVNICEILSI